jgi:hypothetical protein
VGAEEIKRPRLVTGSDYAAETTTHVEDLVHLLV